MEESIKELQSEILELKISIELNEKLLGEVDGLRNEITSMNSNGVVTEEDKMRDEVMKGFGLI